MLGLFDSGSGGLNTIRYIKKYFPSVDLVYKIDRENSPYGTKTQEKIIQITKNNIDDLMSRGAEKILIACCTASTVYDFLDVEYKSAAIPIIIPIANAAMSASKAKRIGIIATDHTVRSHAFKKAMTGCSLTEISAQELVAKIDGGLNDASVSQQDINYLADLIIPIANQNSDTLILGCTHFPALKNTFKRICADLGIQNVIDSAEIGAIALSSAASQ